MWEEAEEEGEEGCPQLLEIVDFYLNVVGS